jgi:hypothetical protein
MLQKHDNEKVYAMIAVDYKKIVNPDAIGPQGGDGIPLAKNCTGWIPSWSEQNKYGNGRTNFS